MLIFVAISASAAPVFDHERGLYDTPFALSIAGGTLHSLDGTGPSLPYTGPIPIDGTTVVRATDGVDVETHTYLFVADVLDSPLLDPLVVGDPAHAATLDATFRALPTLSVVVPDGVSLIE